MSTEQQARQESRVDLFRACESSTLAPLVQTTGQDFFDQLVAFVRRTLDADLVFVGELFGEDWEMVRAVAVSSERLPEKPFEYCLRGTPSEVVVSREIFLVPRGVRAAFPNSPLLNHLEIEGYAGIPLFDSTRRPLGLIVVLRSQPWGDGGVGSEAHRVSDLLEALQNRVASELEHRRTLGEMRTLLESTTMPTSEDVFRSLALQIARAMHVHAALILERTDEEGKTCRVVTACVAGRILEHLERREIPLLNTPCERLSAESVVFEPKGVLERYAGNEILSILDAEAYMGTVITDSNGELIGHLALIHDQPLVGRRLPQHLLRVFSIRAGAELARERAERERLAVERKLLETQKMESLGVLAGGIAHDFNNILVGILGNASLALLEASPKSTSRPFLVEIETAALRAADLARQMLAYSGKGRFVITEVDLNQLVREMVNLLHVSVSKKVELCFDLEPQLLPVRVDATQIRQVVMNLVLNGAESMGDNSGSVTLSTGMMKVRWGDLEDFAMGRDLVPGEYVFLEVSDTGTGMDAETQRKIFDPFFTTKFTGRGLGLAAVQGIVRGHSAALVVDSALDRGSRIRMILPPTDGTLITKEDPSAAAGEWRGSGRVLVVDDEETVQIATARMLERLGFEVEFASDGREAVRLFGEDPSRFRAVLLDLTMPHLNGEEAMLELQACQAEVKVILMSGYSEQEMRARFDGMELTGFLQKPFTLADLGERLQLACSQEPGAERTPTRR